MIASMEQIDTANRLRASVMREGPRITSLVVCASFYVGRSTQENLSLRDCIARRPCASARHRKGSMFQARKQWRHIVRCVGATA